MKTLIAALAAAALLATPIFADEPEGWSRPGGYHDQVKANKSLTGSNKGPFCTATGNLDPDGAGPLPYGTYCVSGASS